MIQSELENIATAEGAGKKSRFGFAPDKARKQQLS